MTTSAQPARSRVVVTGVGAITPVGNNVPKMWSSLLEGRSGVRRITRFDASAFGAQIAAEVEGFDPREHFDAKDARRLDRFTQFAIVAAREALHDAGLMPDGLRSERFGAVVGTAFGGMATIQDQMEVFQRSGGRKVSPFLIPMMMTNSAAGHLAITLGLKGPSLATVTACAAGADAIGHAAETIRRGEADLMLCGGSEASITPLILAAFDSLGVLSTANGDPQRASRPFDARRDGFVMGEGAGLILLESWDHARRRGAHVYAELVGYGATADAVHITAPAEKGEGLARAMQRALDQAGVEALMVDYLNAHGTSTLLNDRHETDAIKTVFGKYAYQMPISSTKSTMGHLIGAGGAVEAIVCVKALEAQMIPPTVNYEQPDPHCDLDYNPNHARSGQLELALSNSMGFGGHNAALLLRRWHH
jgi:3-oxoacyl-[acyl-carrier-protein] synthase II